MTSLTSSLKHTLRNTFKLRGRASRAEYRRFFLAGYTLQLLLAIAVIFTDLSNLGIVLAALLLVVYSIGFNVSLLSLTVRRLHDTDSRGWWMLIPLVPCLLLVIQGDAGSNRFGEPPAV